MTPGPWRKWHSTTGIGAAIFVVFLCVTGFLINHARLLGLDRHYVSEEWLLDWYDIHPKGPPVAYAAAGNWIVRIGDRIYFNRTELPERSERLLGAVSVGTTVFVALRDRIVLLDGQGVVVEVLRGTEGVPAGMRAIGIAGPEGLVVRAAHGDYQPDLDALTWNERDSIEADWSAPADPPAALLNKLLRLYRGRGLTLERVILDVHSGRIFGIPGVLAMDLAALVFVFLAVSGAWLWFYRNGQ